MCSLYSDSSTDLKASTSLAATLTPTALMSLMTNGDRPIAPVNIGCLVEK